MRVLLPVLAVHKPKQSKMVVCRGLPVKIWVPLILVASVALIQAGENGDKNEHSNLTGDNYRNDYDNNNYDDDNNDDVWLWVSLCIGFLILLLLVRLCLRWKRRQAVNSYLVIEGSPVPYSNLYESQGQVIHSPYEVPRPPPYNPTRPYPSAPDIPPSYQKYL